MDTEESSSSTDNEEIFALAAASYLEEQRQRKRKYWVHNIYKVRLDEGEFHSLYGRLQEDDKKFYKYFRMTPEKFNQLVQITETYFIKKNTKWRACIGCRERLTVFLRYLATGADFKTLSFNFRLGRSTVQEIIHSTAGIILESLLNIVLPRPTEDILKASATQFESIWNFPNCVGAIDGKYINIRAPSRSRSLYFNYKKTCSIVLLALVDADYKFIALDVDSYGENSKGSVFANSTMGKALANNTFGMPHSRQISEHRDPLPYVIVGDEAFPAKTYLMRPYSGTNLPEDKRIFNYRLTRARRVVENAFDILCQKFRLFLNKIQVQPGKAHKIILASLCLHNFLRHDNTFINYLEDEQQVQEAPIFCNLEHIGGKPSNDVLTIRENFKQYFCTDGAVEWQTTKVNVDIF